MRDFLERRFDRLAQRDNAVSRKPAGQRPLLEDRHAVAAAREFAGAGKSGGSGADDGDALAGRRRGLQQRSVLP